MDNSQVLHQSFLEWINSGWYATYPLLLCSLIVWVVIFERLWRYRLLKHDLQAFHLSAMNTVLREEPEALKSLCSEHMRLPTARLIHLAIERMNSKDGRVREKWREALERRRLIINQELKENLWILGTIASAAPFIGLFGTVVGILKSFQDIAQTGKGGFAIVAAGISEALIATAAGILVAVIATLAFNAFQTRWSATVLMIRLQIEEISELLGLMKNSGDVHGR